MNTKQKGITLTTEWIIQNCRSFKIVKDSGLNKFAKFLIKSGGNFRPNVNINNLLSHFINLPRNITQLSLFDNQARNIKIQMCQLRGD